MATLEAPAPEELVRANVPLAYYLANRLRNRSPAARRLFTPDELASEGYPELLRCSRTWDPARGVKFCSYAGACMEGRMRRAVEQAVTREERAGRVVALRGQDVADPDTVPERPEPEVFDRLRAGMGKLTDRQREALRLRYWQGLRLAEVGAALGVTRERARQVLVRAVKLLAAASAEGGPG